MLLDPNYVHRLLQQAQVQEHVFWEKELIISYKLANGFVLSGHACCVDPGRFDLEIARKVAYRDAWNQLCRFEAYLLHEKGMEKG